MKKNWAVHSHFFLSNICPLIVYKRRPRGNLGNKAWLSWRAIRAESAHEKAIRKRQVFLVKGGGFWADMAVLRR